MWCFHYGAAVLHSAKRQADAAAKVEKFARPSLKSRELALAPGDPEGNALAGPGLLKELGEALTDMPSIEQALQLYSSPEHEVRETLQGQMGMQESGTLSDSEPFIRDVFTAVTSCNSTLATLNAHMGYLSPMGSRRLCHGMCRGTTGSTILRYPNRYLSRKGITQREWPHKCILSDRLHLLSDLLPLNTGTTHCSF